MDTPEPDAAAVARDIDRLRKELMHAQSAREESERRHRETALLNARLAEQLDELTQNWQKSERRIEELERTLQKPPPADPDFHQAALREQLSVALEELRVMAEELSLARDTLRDREAVSSTSGNANPVEGADR